jgi:hypothetical protein
MPASRIVGLLAWGGALAPLLAAPPPSHAAWVCSIPYRARNCSGTGVLARARRAARADVSVRVGRGDDSFTLPTDTVVAIPFDAVVYDSGSLHDPRVPTRLTAQAAGKYFVWGNVSLTGGDAAGSRQVHIRQCCEQLDGEIARSSAVMPGSGSHNEVDLDVATQTFMQAGEYVELRAYQDSGGDVTVQRISSRLPAFGMVKLE